VEAREDFPWLPLVVALAGAALALPLVDLLIDDTYITLRYGRNLAAGLGPVFNPGEWVEGFTSPAWTLLAALLHVLPVSPVTGMVAGSALAAALGLLLTHLLGGALGLGTRARGLAVCLLVAHADYFGWAFTGMDSPAFVTCGVALLLAAARERPSGAGALAGLLGWVRPEGWALGPMVLVFAFRGSARARALGLWAGLLALLFGLRFWMYQDLLPNTFYAKVPMGWVQLEWGASYLVAGALAGGFGLLSLVALPALGRAREHRGWLVVGLWALAVHGVALVEGGDIFPLGRFLLPALPAVVLMAAGTLEAWLGGSPRRRLVEAGLVLAVLVGSVRPDRVEPALVFREQTRLYEELGAALARQPQGLLATPGAGAIPYVSGFPTLDTVGLCDAVIARAPPDLAAMRSHQKGDPDYVLGRQPRYWIPGLVELPPGPVVDPRARPYEDLVGREHAFPSERGAWQDPRFREAYRAEALEISGGRRFLMFRRRDGEGAGTIRR
jgi:hypothetical protein